MATYTEGKHQGAFSNRNNIRLVYEFCRGNNETEAIYCLKTSSNRRINNACRTH